MCARSVRPVVLTPPSIRCRPLSEKEMSAGNKVAVIVDESRGEICVTNPLDGAPRMFTFDQTYNFE